MTETLHQQLLFARKEAARDAFVSHSPEARDRLERWLLNEMRMLDFLGTEMSRRRMDGLRYILAQL